jgi:G3E family GTPase
VAALAKTGRFDCLLIESTGISEPLPVAETFTFDLDEEEEDSEVLEEEPDTSGNAAGSSSDSSSSLANSEQSSSTDLERHDDDEASSAVPASLRDVARLDSMVTVVDGFNFLKDLGSTTSLAELGAQVGREKNYRCNIKW